MFVKRRSEPGDMLKVRCELINNDETFRMNNTQPAPMRTPETARKAR